jgi:hypothetical protein
MRHCLARNEEVRHIDTELSRAGWAEHRTRVQEGWSPDASAGRAAAGDKP